MNDKWPKSITVDKKIVKILSESTYENFPTSLKEIVTNSYDADSSIVKIDIDLKKEVIVITDDGKGMSEDEFDLFLKIAGTKRESSKNTTPSGRYLIGKFGVGFLSIFPYFKNYTIESKKKGSDRVLFSSIPCYKYFTTGFMDVSEIPIQGGTRIDRTNVGISKTKITLSGFTELGKNFFRKRDVDHKRISVSSYSGIEKLRWRLQEDLPIEYERKEFNVLTKAYSPNLTFKVFINGEQLFRKTYAGQILETHNSQLPFNRVYSKEKLEITSKKPMEIGKIKFHYFILTDKTAVHPIQARSLKLRNLNVGVGDRTAYGLGSEIKGARSRLQWLTGEVLIVSGLNDLINVQRSDFYFDEDYEKLKEFIIERLSYHSTQLENEVAYITESGSTKIKNLKFIKEDETLSSQSLNTKPKVGRPSTKKASVKLDKTIDIRGSIYEVKVSKWDHKKDFYPACKIEGRKVLVNNSYPLFRGVKHTDVFIKLHLLLITSLKNNTIDKPIYSRMVKDILEFYNDYL